MSGIRGIGDGYAFQRLLWLLVGTVLAPTVVLTLFGVAAVRNQRAAIEQELDRQQSERLEIGTRELYALVGELQRRVSERAEACGADLRCDLDQPGVASWWSWPVGEPAPGELVALVGFRPEVEEVATWTSPSDGSGPVATFRHGQLAFGWQLDPAWLDARLTRRVQSKLTEGVVVSLQAPRPGRATPMEDVMARLQESTSVDLILDHPLDRWRLTVDDAAVPTRAVLRRNAWLYPVSLAVLLALVVVGTFVTLGSASREIRLSRLQTDFVSSVSHELRTPLTSIRMFVETLQSGRLDDDPQKVREALDLLALETDRLSRMIERVLDWARMEAGRRIYDREAVPVRELFDASVRALRSQNLLGDDPVTVHTPEVPAVSVDRDAIVEALLNLLQNAVKYTPEPRRIVLSATHEGRWVGLTVADNGPGIAPRERRRVFEKFYQADTLLSSPTQKGADRGSGLGLSIVRAVARAHGGRVELESELGEGSRFTVWLPAATPDHDA